MIVHLNSMQLHFQIKLLNVAWIYALTLFIGTGITFTLNIAVFYYVFFTT